MSNFELHVCPDDSPQNPREDNEFGHMVCFHKRYDLGDKFHGIKHADFSGWDEMEEYLYSDKGACVVLPLYLMDHSGLSISTTSFSCPWDSGQVGFIYMTEDEALEAFQVPKLTEEIKTRVAEGLKAEIETYDAYLRGDVWGFLVKDSDGDVVESAWGYLVEEDARNEGEAVLKCYQNDASV